MICAPVAMAARYMSRAVQTSRSLQIPAHRPTAETMARTLAFTAMLAALLAHVACSLHVVVAPETVTDVLYSAIEWGAVALVAARVIAVRRNRAGWALIGLGVAMWSAGDLCWTLWLNALETAPYPNVSDLFYLGMYVCLYAGLALLLRDRIRPF